MKHTASSDEILVRIADVSAMLHDERGNREELQHERTELVEEARRRGLLGSVSSSRSAVKGLYSKLEG